MRQFSAQLQLSYEASDESDATQKATELTALLQEAGYDVAATTVLDNDGNTVAEFAL